ncbi:hypothetical protein PGT21_014922 [Puccinia graminis f. sp. tritici]|uniref:PEBP-like protein n=1 Tax=Puccinia graminis f. sp. tritici TaxID=56615 RepID=A0A5B0RIF9_PUCGR|nr:hypothetical protein PGT21_014922 [Puccinia graminis f. sp. tritici]KAA1124723.1 hypothetical protein PGTUg99_032714 [Puccinia graminis f. sp. tritici]
MINRSSRLTRPIIPIKQIQSKTILIGFNKQPKNHYLSTTTNEQVKPNVTVVRGTGTKKQSSPSTSSTSIQKAFQESIKFLKEDAERLQQKLKEEQTSADSQQQQEEIERLEILSEINDVQVRKNHHLGQQIDMSKPIYRFLEQQRWRKEGQLGRLMETIHKLRIFPDVYPSINPTVNLKVKYEDTYISTEKRLINVGNFVPSSKSMDPPVIQAQVFHPEPRLYTLVMVDPDVPDPRNHSFTTFLHWLRANVSISATTNEDLDLKTMKESEEEIKYIGPHPAEGSGTHRYTIMLFEQTGPIDLKEHSDILGRSGFSLRRFSSQIGLKPAGVMAWISQWHKRDAQAISSIYRDQLQIHEPRYGKEPKPYSDRIKLPSHTPLPLTHRHPSVIPWRQKISSSNSDPTLST